VALAGAETGNNFTVLPSFLGASGAVTVNEGSSIPLISKVAAIGPFTESDNCVTTSATCIINVVFPATPATTQIGQITVDDPKNLTVGPAIVALSTAGNSTPLTATTTSLLAAPNPHCSGSRSCSRLPSA